MSAPVILWFRRDLRLADQAALSAASQSCAPVIPIYILDDHNPKHRKMGAASRWWLHHSLHALDRDLRAIGSRLILRKGRSEQILGQLASELQASAIHALHHYEPWWRNAEAALTKQLAASPCTLNLHHGNYLLPPGQVITGAGDIYKIFTPFWRSLCEQMPPALPDAAPETLATPSHWPAGDDLADWALVPTNPNWAAAFLEDWQPGKTGAHAALTDFAMQAAAYDQQRNLPSIAGSSRLSPHMHFGEISPATIWHRLADKGGSVGVFLKELGWRDYAQNQIVARPDYGRKNGRAQFDDFGWRKLSDKAAKADFKRWKSGQTGYPIIDAGMRQLWQSGWMHNRVRMLTASFLVKHLLIDWREGEQWFWDTLLDADYASNSVNWQWVAGSGVDANMFVRIMAPLTQSPKFDAGDYIRQYVPELAALDNPAIHDPDAHGARPESYPPKMLAHRFGRERALAAWQDIKG